MATGKSIVFFTKYTAEPPVSRYRSYAQKNSLEKNGFDCTFYPLYSPAASRKWYCEGKPANAVSRFLASLKRLLHLLIMGNNGIVVIEYPLLPGASSRLQNWLLRKQKHVVTDLIFFLPGDAQNSVGVQVLLSRSKVLITPDAVITKRVLSAAGEATQIPPCVDMNAYISAIPASVPPTETKPFRIAWLGTKATSQHLLLIKDCLHQLHDLYHIQLVLIGFDKSREKELQGLPYTIHFRDADSEISFLKSCDAGILPLPAATLPVEALSFAMIQYMACGLPVVASSNEVAIANNHGGDNLFVRTPFEWYSCLAAMIQNKDFYRETGEKNRTIVTDFYSVQKTGKDYLTVIQNIIC